jgi:hypothetical protein
LTDHTSLISKPDVYLSALLDPSSALFVEGSNLAIRLFSQATSGTYESAMTHIRVGGYSASCAIPISSAYYHACRKSASKDVAQRLEMQELLQICELFLLNPNTESCRALSAALIRASTFYDSASLLLGRLLGIDSRFVWVVIAAGRYFAAMNKSKKKDYIAQLTEARDLAPKSRAFALRRIAQQKKDEAFAFALAETDDEALLRQLTTKWSSSSV